MTFCVKMDCVDLVNSDDVHRVDDDDPVWIDSVFFSVSIYVVAFGVVMGVVHDRQTVVG